jgi:hypothetical protein
VIGQVPVRNLPDQDLEVFCCVRFVVLIQRCVVETRCIGAGVDRVGEALNKAIAERQIGFAVFAVFLEDGLVVMLD